MKCLFDSKYEIFLKLEYGGCEGQGTLGLRRLEALKVISATLPRNVCVIWWLGL